MKILIAIFILTNFLFIHCNAQQTKFKKALVLKADCFFEQKKRKIIDSITNQIATVTKKGNNYLLLIGDKKYIACNLPDNFEYGTVLITGYVLQSLQTEKLIATPLKITKAFVTR